MMTATPKQNMHPAIELMDRVLREHGSVVDEFPLVFRAGFTGQVVSIGEEGVPRSACTILMRTAVTPEASFPFGMVGSVTTEADYRQNGLATRVLLAAEERLAEQGAIVSMLWADDPRFYYARGYRPIGCELDFVVDGEVASRLPALEGVRTTGPGDAEAIHEHYSRHAARIDRTAEETAALLECPGMTTLVHEVEGTVRAYACMGRGEDLGGTIHEWGGELDSVLGLVRAHAESGPEGEPAFLIAPTTATELAERMTAVGAPPSTGLLGLAKVVNREAAARLLASLLGDAAEITFDPEAPETEQVRIVTRSCDAHLNDDTLLVLLFSSKGERAEIEGFGEHFEVPVDRLPLRTFVWGLDSI